MYESIKGILQEKEPSKAIVETMGICYRISIPLNTYTKLPQISHSVLLFLTQVVREESNTLYGFLEKSDRDLFENLIQISGIGPKTGIAIIGHLSSQDLYQAIASSNLAMLSKIPGIGKKTAERLVIEMRDKFKSKEKFLSSVPSQGNNLTFDAVHALLNLGYTMLDAQKAVQTALKESPEETDLAHLIAKSLQKA